MDYGSLMEGAAILRKSSCTAYDYITANVYDTRAKWYKHWSNGAAVLWDDDAPIGAKQIQVWFDKDQD